MSSEKTQSGSASPIRVLHVDDEPKVAELTADMLEREDDRFTVETATSASDGLARITETTYDCIVSDYQMPGQNGIEFLDTVHEERPDLPFILYTGHGSEAIASDAISAGVTDYLQKENGTEQYKLLANRIENAVVQYRTEQRAATTNRRLHALSEASADILWLVTADWSEFLFVNSAYEDIWGRSIDALYDDPMDFMGGVHPEDHATVTAAMERVSNGDMVDFEFRVNAEEDFQRWVWVQAEPVYSEAGDPDRIAGFVRDITERKEREATLSQRESIVQEMNDGAVIVQDGTLKYANPRVSELVGYGRDELVETPMVEFIAPEYRDTIRQRHRARLAGDDTDLPNQYELELLAADGERIPVELSISRIEYDGQPATLSLVRDVTERKHQKERFQAFLEHSTDIISVLDPKGTYQYQSPSSKRVLGYEPEELLGETAFEYIHPDDREDVMETFSEAVEDPEMIPTTEYRFKHKDGSWRWLESIGNNQLDNPAIEGFVVNSRDITERKKYERDIQRTRDRMEFALDATDAVVWKWNVDTDQATFYPSEEELYGTTVETRADFMDVIHPDDRQKVREALEISLETGEPKHEAVRIVRDDDVRWIEAPGKPVSDDDGTTRMIGVVRDITDRKHKERKLERQNERLDRFASVISHDLRNPLNVAGGRLELARDEYDSAHLDAIEQMHERMEQLIDDILVLARGGSQVRETEPVAVAPLAERSWQTVATAEATLVTEPEHTIQADQSRLQQLLENLYRNAVEHGGEDVTITLSDLDEEVGFVVADDGPGIPEDEHDQVFDSGYSTAENGTGLGLTIVREIAHAHDWEVSVTDSAAGGARFEFETQQ